MTIFSLYLLATHYLHVDAHFRYVSAYEVSLNKVKVAISLSNVIVHAKTSPTKPNSMIIRL